MTSDLPPSLGEVHKAAATGFNREAGTYASARPSYHPAVITRFVERFGDGEVIELGAGTGILTRQLVDARVRVIAIEPLHGMRRQLEAESNGAIVRSGTAETTGLDEGAADTVVVGQAFHWFDHGPALDEIARVLRTGGHLVCLWNVRDTSVDWVSRITDLAEVHASGTPRYHTMEWRRAIEGDDRFVLVDEHHVDHPIPSSPDGVVGRALSTSFIAALDDTTRTALLDDIRDVVEPLGQKFDYPYRSELQAWRLD